MSHDNLFIPEEKVKIVLLGSPSVGKTSLLNRWICGDYNHRVSPTIAAANVQKDVTYKGRTVRAVICDTAGEERYQSLCGNFIHGADCAIVVCSYDIEASIEALDSWIDLVFEKCPPTTTVIIAKNKLDLISEFDGIMNYKNYPLYQVSAKTGENIDVLFLAAVNEACNSHFSQTDIVNVFPSLEPTKTQQQRDSCC